MNETRRGVIIFVTALVTIWLWAPLSSNATRAAGGVVLTDTYFGPLRYLTLHTELKEPTYQMDPHWAPGRLVLTALITAALWSVVVWKVRRKGLDSGTDSAEA